MASIRKRSRKRQRARWQATVRLPGSGTVSMTFDWREQARHWGVRTEFEIRRGVWVDPRLGRSAAAWVDEVIREILETT